MGASNRHFIITGHLIISIIKLSFGREVLAATSPFSVRLAALHQARAQVAAQPLGACRGSAACGGCSLCTSFSIPLGDKGMPFPSRGAQIEMLDLNRIT